MRNRLLTITILAVGLSAAPILHGDVTTQRTQQPFPIIPLKPMPDARCERRSFPPRTPIHGCFFKVVRESDGSLRMRCLGECVKHDNTTLYFNVCVPSQGSTCNPYQIQIRIGSGRVAPCEDSYSAGWWGCTCPPDNPDNLNNPWQPVGGRVVTINVC